MIPCSCLSQQRENTKTNTNNKDQGGFELGNSEIERPTLSQLTHGSTTVATSDLISALLPFGDNDRFRSYPLLSSGRSPFMVHSFLQALLMANNFIPCQASTASFGSFSHLLLHSFRPEFPPRSDWYFPSLVIFQSCHVLSPNQIKVAHSSLFRATSPKMLGAGILFFQCPSTILLLPRGKVNTLNRRGFCS